MKEAYHFIGIAGIGMSAIARLLLQQGKKVSGNDLSASPLKDSLRALGAEIFDVHAASNVSERCTVVYSSDIKNDHVELQKARELGCRILHRSEMLAQLFHAVKFPLAVTGTHGKTTTSSLLTTVLRYAQQDPCYAVGGILQKEGVNSGWGKGQYFVIEADESDSSFLHYSPYGAIVTNIDLDHMNHFKTEKALIEAFKTFTEQVFSKQHLVWCGDDERLCSLKLPGVCYGFNTGCDFQIKNYKQTGWKSVFDIVWKDHIYSSVEISLPGKHAALNAAAVFALCTLLGIEEEGIRGGLASFGGVKRRAEKIPSHENVTIIDDYAHHPTEVEATLKGIRLAAGSRRLIAVFQPHRYSRLATLVNDLPQFYKSYLDADQVVVTDLYAAGEQPIEGINTKLVYDALKQKLGSKVYYCPKETLIKELNKMSHPQDVYIFLGAGDITKIAHEAAGYFREHPPRKWKIGVVFGGPSAEHHISFNSARFIIQNLSPQIFDIETFGISKSGEWRSCKPEKDIIGDKTQPKALSAEVLESLLGCDVFFPIMHGTFGEDGVVQGFLETLGKPYVGCGHRSSALCMDKVLAKKVAAYHGLPIVPFMHVGHKEWLKNRESITAEIASVIKYPAIVKPSHLGSSICVSEVSGIHQLEEALDNVFKADTDAIIEKRLKARDIEFAVLGNEEAVVFPPGEVCTGGEIYSYEDKTGSKHPPTDTKAALSPHQISKGMELALEAYKACGCQGWARVDFLLDEEGTFWFNEINPIPGCSAISLYPRMCELHGFAPQLLLNELVLSAFAKHREQQHKYTYQP